jgi:hypothetical protein
MPRPTTPRPPLPKKRGGRPALPKDQKRDVRVVVLLTRSEWEAFEARAEKLGTSTVELARKRLVEA